VYSAVCTLGCYKLNICAVGGNVLDVWYGHKIQDGEDADTTIAHTFLYLSLKLVLASILQSAVCLKKLLHTVVPRNLIVTRLWCVCIC
jgi:hypothetical protein